MRATLPATDAPPFVAGPALSRRRIFELGTKNGSELPMRTTHGFTRALLDVAADIDEAEREIKEVLLKAAEEGDLGRIREIVKDWIEKPVSQVLAKGLRRPPHDRSNGQQ